MRRARASVWLFALLACGGCGADSTARAPALGRTIEAARGPVGVVPAPVGDPPAERGGSVPPGSVGEENTVAAGAGASTPQAALRRYALAYTNWQAATLPAHERRLAALAIGPARLAAQQTAAGLGVGEELIAHHVRNRGIVVAITPGEGTARGRWVVVTREQTSGTGAYAGLPPALHVTLARVRRVRSEWIVWGWWPGS